MNNILEMIKNEKVEWKKLGDVKEVKTVSAKKKYKKQEYLDKGLYPIIDQGQDFIAGYTNDGNFLFDENSYVVFGDHTEAIKYVDFPFAQGADGIKVIKTCEEYINSKYLYHVLLNFYKITGDYKRHFSILKELEIPIPSLETQERIVKILDTMVGHFTQLEAELEARNKQYEYYRDKLLSEEYLNKLTKKFGGEVEYLELGDIGEFFGGLSGKNKNDFINGNERFITYKNVFNNISTNICPEDMVKIDSGEKQRVLQCGDIIFTGSSEIEEESGYSSVITEYVSHPLYLNSFCFFLRLNNKDILIPDFSKFLFRSKNIRKQIIKTASGVTRFNVSKVLMEKIIIPIPPIPVQKHIVSILDSFNKIVTDINEGLPKEIELRQKQYEYYRESLLDFKREDE